MLGKNMILTDKEREKRKTRMIEYNKSEKGRENSRKNATKNQSSLNFGKTVLIKYNKSEKGRKTSGLIFSRPKTEKQMTSARESGRKNLIKLNNSLTIEEKRRRAQPMIIAGIEYIRSERGRQKSKEIGTKIFIKYNKSEKGREKSRQTAIKNQDNPNFGRQFITKYNKSEKHKQQCAKNLFHKPTNSQVILSKSLSSEGIEHRMEWWIPEIHRIIDIAILSNKIAIEVDGESHTDPFPFYGISKEQKQADDKLKDQQLQSLGWKVLRFSNEDVKNRLQEIIKKVDIFV